MQIFRVVEVYDDLGYHFSTHSIHRTREGAEARAQALVKEFNKHGVKKRYFESEDVANDSINLGDGGYCVSESTLED